MSDNALKVLYRLKNAGYKAFLVGGSVRDLLLGREPKDFDVVTDARPEQIRELFRNCHLIGRRFRLAHVRFGLEIIEVSTFRASHNVTADDDGHSKDGRILRDNVYGDIDDDVWRRDFTVNALFYNIEDFTVLDYVGAMQDITDGQLRLIGDPVQRFTEDPVRLLRAVRFAVKLGFRIHPQAEQSIHQLGHLLEEIPPARLFEEVLKLFMGGYALQTFEMLRHYDLFKYLFPQTERILNEEEGGFPHMFLIQALKNTDQRISEEKTVNPAFLLAALLWEPLQKLANDCMANGLSEMESIQLAGDSVISRQISGTAMPRRFTQIAREIWSLQPRLKNRTPKRVLRLTEHPRFRAAYDFLLLRAQAGEAIQDLADWWTAYLAKTGDKVEADAQKARPHPPRLRRRRRRRGSDKPPSS
ncbi:MAG: poly(A) polymerase [Gammaproteobacteria bacterium RBG_16_51_14]|nr:MAG: poly(A) polymerase [Gammaproteobacteria bacterium RBG_16_51_14]